jgi:hypothetical protein
MLAKDYIEVTPMTGMCRISAHILESFPMLPLFWKCDTGMNNNSENETSYTIQIQLAFLMYVENKYCDKDQHVPVNGLERLQSSNLVHSVHASGSCRLSFDPYDLSSDDEEYLVPNNVAETIP